MQLTSAQASTLAQLPLTGLTREYPNAPGLVLNGPDDLRTPRQMHPAFYGCFDWHSAVHSIWTLVRLLSRFDLPTKGQIVNLLDDLLTADNLEAEAAYFAEPNHASFERMYGWTWLLKLATEVRGGPNQMWRDNLRPLEDKIVELYLQYLPKATYPIRSGLHSNSAFGVTFALDYAGASGNEELETLIVTSARRWFEDDADYPGHLEPGGSDFLSPVLTEADLMHRVLAPDEFQLWFSRLMPTVPQSILEPPHISDVTDPQIGHLVGLNLSRAWCMQAIARSLPVGDTQASLEKAATVHGEVGLANVVTGDFMGEHWLATFAVYLMT